MGLYMNSHAVACNVDEVKIEEEVDGFLSMYMVDGHYRVQLSMTPKVAEDLVRRLEAYLMDRQMRAHPETVPGPIEVNEG